ncbi:Mut7-C RNAse domain-containing protein [Natronobacterium gregoryi]|uniref:Mut7-C RNAse domain-containing protein n=2 Tax=Natronobacterium gregoryi TaxID=44930 RepID=L0AH61_NATGS|nr:DUF5615 family PIN-like protein [Natronobacterium gregoryi]AFZ73233.1 hypothetical protein Natgr_2050 [Natronobacterium gregoryi SP2]ELY71309.1 hypothetical protein C490_05242 [Natronobacterium gregoryi SP2]PLK21641.1 hypothetical protein CYV19_03525 [Natronobacterium gregoryi SP2]SFI57854.1 hypothetical protein SAMN05443661_10231 [Natronobacterium gregoryi]
MRLLLDVMCGGIVSSLRMCNHDTVYAGDRDLEADDAILETARTNERTLVTRDVALANRATEKPGSILLESRDVDDQLSELAAAGVPLEPADEPRFCGRCNGPLEAVDRSAETPEYVPDTGVSGVRRCRSCDQYFWRGSHWERVERTLSRIVAGNENERE